MSHPSFGPGTVRAVLDGGRKIRVAFDQFPGIPYVLPIEQFAEERAQPEATATKVRETGARVASPPVATPPPAEVAKPRVETTLGPGARSSGVSPVETAPVPPPRAERVAPAPADLPAAPPPEKPVPQDRKFLADARQLFEALRMGVVPPALLDRYTVGRDSEIARLREFLRSGRGILVFEGHYGTGKTHLIELAASEALAAGFLVSRVSFDPVEIPPSNPLRTYRELVHSLRYPPGGSGGGLAPLLSALSRSKARRAGPGAPEFHRYLSPALFAVAEGDPEVVETVLAFVEGRGDTSGEAAERALRALGWRGPRILALPDWRTFGQVYMYILGGIASWARDAGHRGLVVLFDEAESMDSLEKTSRDFADTFLKYFAAATLPESELGFRPASLYRGGQEVHRAIPHVYRSDQPLAGVFAFTPLPKVSEAVVAAVGGRDRVVELKELSEGVFPVLAERLSALYAELYPEFSVEKRAWNRFLRHIRSGVRAGALASTRAVARLTVEWLDLLRHGRDALSALEGFRSVER